MAKIGAIPGQARPWGIGDTTQQGTRGPLCYKAIILKNRDVVDFLTHRNRQRLGETEKTEKFSPNEQIGQGHSQKSKQNRYK